MDILIQKDCPNGHGRMTLFQQSPNDDTDDFFECAACGTQVFVIGQRSAENDPDEED